MNRHWDIVESNGAAARFFGLLLEGRRAHGAGNVLRLMFHPDGLRPDVENWDAVAGSLVQRVHREAIGGALDDTGRAILAEVLDYPGVPARAADAEPRSAARAGRPGHFRHREQAFRSSRR